MWGLKQIPQQNPETAEADPEAAQRTPAQFGFPDSFAVTDRDFLNLQSCFDRFCLHLDIPSGDAVAHLEAFQRLISDGAEGSHIGIAVPIQAEDEKTEQAVA